MILNSEEEPRFCRYMYGWLREKSQQLSKYASSSWMREMQYREWTLLSCREKITN